MDLLKTLVLFVSLLAAPAIAGAQVDSASDTAVKAAYLFNFAKFTEWPSLAPAEPLVFCVIGDPRVGKALADTVRGQRIGERSLQVRDMDSDGAVRSCHVLFVSKSETRQAREMLESVRSLPILTVSDGRGFAESGGMLEFFIDSERMRFAVNTKAVDRAGVRLSSRLLGLARIDRDARAS